MANTTIYPYGTNGQLPSSIGVINDLTTGGADKALSAEMGKMLRKAIAGLLSELSPTAFTGPKPTESDLGIYAPKFTITLPTDTRVDMTNQGTQVEAGDSYTNTFSLNETAEEGYVLRLSATMEGGGEISADSTTGVVSTNNVTGNITIVASAGVAPMKVHSYAYPASSDSLGDCLVDSVGGFNLYLYNSTTKSTFVNLGSANNPNAAFQDGWFGNGKSSFLRKSNSTGTIEVEDDHDFTLIFKGWKLSISGNSVYNNSQNKYPFFDESVLSRVNEATNANNRFGIWMRTYDASATSLGGGRPGFPAITYIENGEKEKVFAASNSSSLGCFLDMSTLAHDVIISYNASTKKATAWVAKEISGNKVLKLTGTVDVTALSIQCIQMPSSSTFIQGLDIYNYAMTEQEAATATNSVIS